MPGVLEIMIAKDKKKADEASSESPAGASDDDGMEMMRSLGEALAGGDYQAAWSAFKDAHAACSMGYEDMEE